MKWIRITETGTSASGKTKTWWVRSEDGQDFLGEVKWYAPWRKYAFYPAAITIFEQDCLRDIASFIEEKTKEHRAKKASASHV